MIARNILSIALATVVAATASAAPNDGPAKKKRDLGKGNTLFVVPYAHLDTQWRWAYPQVIREFIASTLHNNFALIDKYPHYLFNFSGSRRYEMMKEYYPADYERLKGYIKAGRWFPCGSSVDEGDANVPSAESLIRHVLYGNHYFRREFGVASQEFMLPDCFGFPYALPSILNYCGIQGFSTQKLTWGSAVGIPFKVGTWEGPDGKSIVAALDPGSYGGSVAEDLSQNTSWLARIENTGQQSGAYVDYHYYGTGDRGGSPNASSVDWIEKSIDGHGPITVVSSQSDEMFTDLTQPEIAKLPHYKGELLLTAHSAGSISSEAYMKRWNRKNELLANGAETASVAAMWLGSAVYPSKRLYNAWDLVLGSQMHDMLPGTSIPKAYEFCWNDELLALNQFAAVEKNAVGSVAASMDTRGQGAPLIVYNPLSRAREDVAEATISGVPKGKGVQVYGPDGKTVPTQILSNDGNGAHILFLAKVPSAGMAVFHAERTQNSADMLEVGTEGRSHEVAQAPMGRKTLAKGGSIRPGEGVGGEVPRALGLQVLAKSAGTSGKVTFSQRLSHHNGQPEPQPLESLKRLSPLTLREGSVRNEPGEGSAMLRRRRRGTPELAMRQPLAVSTCSLPLRPSARTERLGVAANNLENATYTVSLNQAGDISSIFDKVHNLEILKAPIRLAFQYENPSQFPAWNMDWDDQNKPPRGYVEGPAKVEVIEKGPVRVALRVTRESEGSKFVQDIRLAAGDAGDRIEVANHIDWQSQKCALKATFPLATGNPEATYDLQLGAIKRGNNNPKKYEVPQHQWIDLTKPDDSYGVAILNDGKYASDKPDDDTLRLTMIYTPGTRAGYADQGTQDIGKQDCLFAIAPHANCWQKANVPWEAKRLNQPLRVFETASHSGSLGKSFSLISTNSSQVEISAIKKAEDSDEIVVRLRELDGTNAAKVEVRSAGGIASAREVNGQEQPLGSATVRNGALVTDLSGFSLRSFAIKLNRPSSSRQTANSTPVDLHYNADVVSSVAKPSDGAFNAKGETISAEQYPSSLTVDGVDFKLGPTRDGAKNAVEARGQQIELPAGKAVYLLAASSNGDVPAEFKIGGRPARLTVQDWNGYIGQWDNRHWAGNVGINYTNYGDTDGLTPGYVKPGEVAWWCSHKHDPENGNEFYQYSYLYKYRLENHNGSRTLTFPDDPRIKVMAISVANDPADETRAAAPLYDTLADHQPTDGPTISPASGTFKDVTTVTLAHPLYWRKGELHYTLDGSTPTASSRIYAAPLELNGAAKVRVAEIDRNGRSGPVASADLDIHDTTPPSVAAATSPKALGFVRVQFSEAVTAASAENVRNYRLSSGTAITRATYTGDGKAVELTLEKPLAAGQTETLTVSGIEDLAKNTSSEQTATIQEKTAVFTSPELEPKTTKSFVVDNLPQGPRDHWTLNLFCKIDSQPEDRTLIAGFGRAFDGANGTGRYFSKFKEGINFWVCNEDIKTTTPLDIGTWQMLTATFDGTSITVYKNGEKIGERTVELSRDRGPVRVMPLDAWERKRKFNGEVRDLTIWDENLSQAAVQRLWAAGK